jgi:hypothetical protein
MGKKTIKYKQAFGSVDEGWSAFIELAEDHPDTSSRLVHTSVVVRDRNEAGEFETLNTIYVKAST